MHTLTSAPLGLLHATVEFPDGGRTCGFASDLLVPKWFEKNPDKSPADDVQSLVDSAQTAIAHGTGGDHRSVFELWRDCQQACLHGIDIDAPDRLVHGYGPSLLERALIDAACRASQLPFHEALRSGLLGFDAASLDTSLTQWSASRLPAPRTTLALRHTVGLVDALTVDDIESRVNDGLPECLEQDIEAAGLTHFKLKVSGQSRQDHDRLIRIAKLVQRRVGPKACFTLDGNEQFDSMSEVADLLDGLTADEAGRFLLERLHLVEQPLSRTVTFNQDRIRGIERVSAWAPVIIDEADADLDALPRAAALGYGGVSMKNCKGVFRAVLNRARCDLNPGLLLSGEDLTTLPIIPLQQDLATVALLGPTHVERNGHHYFKGLAHLPKVEAESALEHHGDLYEPLAGDQVQLRIRHGQLSLERLHRIGFGYAVPPDVAARTPAAEWRWTEVN